MDSTMAESKRALRKHFRNVREDIPEEERARVDARITARLESLDAWANARAVFTYLSFGAEVSTRELIADAWEQGKLVALPRVVSGTRKMRWFSVTSFDGLEHNAMGMDEPYIDETVECDPVTTSDALAIVPGLTFDEQGYRLGYGGGYYDTLLAGITGVTVGICREAQFTPDLHAEGVVADHDLPVDIVVTDERLFIHNA